MTRNLVSREIIYLPLSEVSPNPYQPRRMFDREQLEELAGSIREYGVLQPISVRLINHSRYELVAGERRLRACKLAGLEEIPAILVNINDLDSAVLAIIENLQRQDLHFFEEAEGFSNLMTDYGFTQEVLAERVGKKQSTIANKLRVLKLSKEAQKIIIENELSERHARAILKCAPAMQLEVLARVVKQGLTVRKTEELVAAMLAAQEEPAPVEKKGRVKRYIRDIRLLTNSIKADLEMVRESGVESDFDMCETDEGCDIYITLHYKRAENKHVENMALPLASGL